MQNRVISLTTALERREHIRQQFGQQNIEFDFLDALTPASAAEYASQLGLSFATDALTQGEIACFMSHVALWDQMVKQQIAVMAIFEDDVFLGQSADSFLRSDKWLPKQWSVIKLEAFSKKVLLARAGQQMPDERLLYELKGRHLGAAGYVLNLKSAEYLMQLIKSAQITEPLDHILFDLDYHRGQSYLLHQLKPALCIQGYLYKTENNIFSSTLENQRVERREKESQQRNLYTKLMRELSRLVVQLNQVLYKRKMDFK